MAAANRIRIDQLDSPTPLDLEGSDFSIPARRGGKEVKVTVDELAQVIIRAAAFGALASKNEAAGVPFDPGASGIAASTVQEAIEALQASLAALGDAVDGKQSVAENLTAIATLEGAADQLPYFSGPAALALTAVTSVSRQLLGKPSVSAMQQMLGVGGTLQASVMAAGTAIDFTSIPSDRRFVTLIFSQLSTDGNSNAIIQIGDSGGFEAANYASTASNTADITTATAGIVITDGSPQVSAASYTGAVTFHRVGSLENLWVAVGCVARDGINCGSIAGRKALAGDLDRLRLTTSNGTDTFDGGAVSIIYG